MKNERIEWLDIAKAISIILVVLGHAGHAYLDVYLGWFRMPLFFFLSGILFKPVLLDSYLKWAKNKTFRMMVPYAVYGVLIFMIFNYDQLNALPSHLYHLLYGGSSLQGPYGIFWFITVLLLTQLLMGLISSLKHWIQISIIAILFVVGHSPFIIQFDWVWSMNVVMVALFYYALGSYTKNWIFKYGQSIIIAFISLSMACIAVYLNANGSIDYYLNLKMNRYNSVPADIIIPLLFFMPVIYFSHFIARFKIKHLLQVVGSYSIVIMYMHLPVNIFLRNVLNYDVSTFEFTFFGVVIPVILGSIFNLTSITQILFLGQKTKRRI